MKKTAPIRLNLLVSPAVKARIERLMTLTDAGSMTEVVRRALVAYEFIAKAQSSGGEALVRDGDGSERTLVVL